MKKRGKQIKKEAIITLIIYLIYFLWWYFFAFYNIEKPENYTYVLGLPYWFFMSCIVVFFMINILLLFVIKLVFKDMDLD